MFVPLAEVYQQPDARAVAERYFWRNGSLDEVLGRAGALATITEEDALMAHLEALPDYDWNDTRRRAAELLGHLPTSVLLSNFGETVTAWALANFGSREGEHLAEALEEEGYDARLLTKAVYLAWEERQPPRGRDVLKQNAVAEAILGGALDRVNLASLVRQCPQPGVTLSEKRPHQYSIIPLRAEDGGLRAGGWVYGWEGEDKVNKPGVHYRLGLDTIAGFALMHKGIPQAEIGLVAGPGEGELQIRQMQRVWGHTYDPNDPKKRYTGLKHPRELLPLDWQKLVVGITAELAEGMGLSSVGIVSGKKAASSRDNHMTYEQVSEMYDVPADRLHFSPDQDGNWHMSVAKVKGLLASPSV